MINSIFNEMYFADVYYSDNLIKQHFYEDDEESLKLFYNPQKDTKVLTNILGAFVKKDTLNIVFKEVLTGIEIPVVVTEYKRVEKSVTGTLPIEDAKIHSKSKITIQTIPNGTHIYIPLDCIKTAISKNYVSFTQSASIIDFNDYRTKVVENYKLLENYRKFVTSAIERKPIIKCKKQSSEFVNNMRKYRDDVIKEYFIEKSSEEAELAQGILDNELIKHKIKSLVYEKITTSKYRNLDLEVEHQIYGVLKNFTPAQLFYIDIDDDIPTLKREIMELFEPIKETRRNSK